MVAVVGVTSTNERLDMHHGLTGCFGWLGPRFLLIACQHSMVEGMGCQQWASINSLCIEGVIAIMRLASKE